MKITVYSLCLFALLGFSIQVTAQQALLNEAMMLRDKDFRQALDLYEQVLSQDPNNIEALSEAGLLLTRLGNRNPNKEEKKVYFTKALNYTKKAVSLNPNSAIANYTYGVALGRIGDISGARERVQNAEVIKSLVEKALQLDPNHAPSWHLLGRLNYRLSNLNVAERAAAAVLYGGLPDGVSNENAVKFYEKAVELKGDYLLYRLDLAIALIKVGNKVRAKEVLEVAVNLPFETDDEKEYLSDCKSLLTKLGGKESKLQN